MTNFTFCFIDFIAVFDKKANISGSIDIISRQISSPNHDARSIDRYQLFHRTWYFLFWKTARCSKDWPKILFAYYLQFLHGGNDFQGSSITFDNSNNSTFFGTSGKKMKFINFHSTLSSVSATISTPTGTIANLMCSFFLFCFLVV